MMSDNLQEENNLLNNIEPPEVKLTSPSESQVNGNWLVVAKNKRVNRDWEDLMQRYPENCYRCYQDLCNSPIIKQPKRVFPLKGKRYQGIWEYEVTSGDRVFYIPDEKQLKVVIYYAGKHPKNAPIP